MVDGGGPPRTIGTHTFRRVKHPALGAVPDAVRLRREWLPLSWKAAYAGDVRRLRLISEATGGDRRGREGADVKGAVCA